MVKLTNKVMKSALMTALLLSPVFAQAEEGFNIKIVAGLDAKSSSVVATGYSSEVITDDERKKFGIEDSALKKAVDAYFGKKPKDAYVKSKTPWGDLYKKYSWTEVHRVTRVHSAKILEVSSEPSILAKKTFRNTSNVAGTFNASISQEMTNTTESNWSMENSISVSQSFSYDVSFLGTGGGGETGFEYTHTWGQGGSESQSVTVGTAQGVSVYLEPGEEVSSHLNVSKGTMKVEVVYEVYLTGTTAINYNPKYKGHHFWDLGIAGVMQSGGINNKIYVKQIIEVGFYSDGAVVLSKVSK
jgi:post-segregation antitoxin (ccd killing protein)